MGNVENIFQELDNLPQGWIVLLETSAERMLDIYIERCNKGPYWKRNNIKTDKQIREFLCNQISTKQEWYMTPHEAVDMGFVDGVLGDDGFENIKNLREEE